MTTSVRSARLISKNYLRIVIFAFAVGWLASLALAGATTTPTCDSKNKDASGKSCTAGQNAPKPTPPDPGLDSSQRPPKIDAGQLFQGTGSALQQFAQIANGTGGTGAGATSSNLMVIPSQVGDGSLDTIGVAQAGGTTASAGSGSANAAANAAGWTWGTALGTAVGVAMMAAGAFMLWSALGNGDALAAALASLMVVAGTAMAVASAAAASATVAAGVSAISGFIGSTIGTVLPFLAGLSATGVGIVIGVVIVVIMVLVSLIFGGHKKKKPNPNDLTTPGPNPATSWPWPNVIMLGAGISLGALGYQLNPGQLAYQGPTFGAGGVPTLGRMLQATDPNHPEKDAYVAKGTGGGSDQAFILLPRADGGYDSEWLTLDQNHNVIVPRGMTLANGPNGAYIPFYQLTQGGGVAVFSGSADAVHGENDLIAVCQSPNVSSGGREAACALAGERNKFMVVQAGSAAQ